MLQSPASPYNQQNSSIRKKSWKPKPMGARKPCDAESLLAQEEDAEL